MRIKIKLAVILLCITLIIFSVVINNRPEERALANDDLIRLHVIANSDSPEDQALKLKVRDGLLERYTEVFKAVNCAADAKDAIRENAVEIRRLAKKIIKDNGYDYDVEVELGTYSFPTKMYGKNVYPAGDYEALRIIIGSGQGANWWCVMFPPLCFVDVSSGVAKEQDVHNEEGAEDETADGFDLNDDSKDNDDVNTDWEEYDDQVTEVKHTFILLEWWNKLVGAIKSLF